MNIYKVLKKQEFKKAQYSIVPIRAEDRYLIMNWRNEQIYHLRQKAPLTKEDQDRYFESVVSKLFSCQQPEQILFSYLEGDVCIGYGGLVHINWADGNAEISFVMNTELEKEYFNLHWSNFLELIEGLAFKELSLHKIFTYAFDLRPHLYSVLESSSFNKEATLNEHCLFDYEYRDVIIHSKINPLKLRKVTEADTRTIFDWANESEVRMNSLNQEPIKWEDHLKWFQSKIKDPNSRMFVLEENDSLLGQVRFDFIDGKWLVNYSIDKNFRGRGFGAVLIKMALKRFENQDFLAKVKRDNIASKKVFLGLGFSLNEEVSGEVEEYVLLRNKLISN